MLLLLFLSNVQPQRGLHARGDRDVEKSHFLTFCSEKTDKYVKTPHFCAVFSVLHLSSTHFGPRWETRTPDILLPNQARYQLRYTRIFNFCHDTTAEGKIKDFSVCGHLCGQRRFCAAFCNRGKSRKRRRRKALRRFASPYPGYNHGTPKPGTIPTSLYPDTIDT